MVTPPVDSVSPYACRKTTPEDLGRVLQQGQWHRRGSVDQELQGTPICLAHSRKGGQDADHRGNGDRMRDFVLLHQRDEFERSGDGFEQ